ncbi:MAG: serine protein kinase [Phycisphaerae bacterium]|nr:MAG: serine protein kinase [Planctomycetota bacterium]KAB2948701.1 MAG: serine protein kinase [Phycisphaerae bacterium]MBE7455551.1 serine protein kinase [Planctomycetia bacterium]MCK6466159.1 serine protein kinase [Phycisphaerae bacterium]MCL4719936.1 serine protein kinase [Phycisphaerae bacterium]
MADAKSLVSLIESRLDAQAFREQHWEGSFEEYLELVARNPRIARNAFQRIYDMILHFGTERYMRNREEIIRYKFFSDPIENGADAVFGLDRPLMNLVDFFKSASHGYGTERRILLLHGPVGSCKSTIARLLKKGLEYYSRLEEGALYTFSWHIHDDAGKLHVYPCPMHEEPLKLIPIEARREVLRKINEGLTEGKQVRIEGALDPFCRRMFEDLLVKYEGNWRKVMSHVRVRRFILSEKDRRGIGTFQPKDEKNQDSTELTGDINYRKIAEYGSDSDPRAFNFDGELNIANRGIVEFIEVLKLEVAFLYDLLGASQEHVIKPKKFAQTDIDEVIIGHTNEPEYRKLQSNELMEAFRDRTIKIDIPYNIRLDDEIAIYHKDFNKEKIRGIHIAPHTIETAAMWAVLTRLDEPKKAGLTLLQKLKLYNGKSIPNFTEDTVRELRDESPREGMQGISPRYIQDKLSNCLVGDQAIQEKCINPFMVLNEIEGGLDHHSLLNDEDTKKQYKELLGVVREEYEDILKSEVQRAISADEDAIKRLCTNYIENVRAYTQREKVRNKYTGRDEEPDERLMRSIEEKIDIPDSRKDDFRQEIMNYIGALALDGKRFEYHTNARLHKALELKLFEDQRDTIKLKNVVSGVVDDETQAKIDVVKQRLIKYFGYNETSATDVLNYVASIFARGDSKKDD